jgi:hypothetical protein
MEDKLDAEKAESTRLERSREINSIEKSLSDAQRMEIRRRYDLAVAVGMSAHKIKNEIVKLEATMKIGEGKITNYESFYFIFVIFYFALRFAVSDSLFEMIKKYEWYFLTPLLAYGAFLFFQRKEEKLIVSLKQNLAALEVQWNSCSPKYSLQLYIDNRNAHNINASDRGDFSLVALALRESIIGKVDFKYNWC